MTILGASGIAKAFGERTLFSNVNFRIDSGDKIGFVGENGCGKTTLLKLITGELSADEGGFARKSGLQIGYLEQHTCADSERTAFAEALTVFSKLIEMDEEINKINISLSVSQNPELLERQAELNESFASLGGLTFKSRTRSTLIGLGLKPEELELEVRRLSGGQKSKIGLAKLLLSNPQLILLDEPTNHLDIASVEWLEDYLISTDCAALVISHDRYFLDKVTNRTFELTHKSLVCNSGNYSRHLELEAERRITLEREYENTVKEIKRIEGIIEQQRTFSMERNYRTIEHKQKSIDRLKAGLVKPDRENDTVHFRFNINSDTGNDVLRAQGLTKVFGQRTLFCNIDLDIKRGERIFLLGENGCGKTTLLKEILYGNNVKFGARVAVGYFDQLQADLNTDNSVLDEIWNTYTHLTETTIRNALAAFLFCGDEVYSKIDTLSGGERARVALCKLMLSGNNLLLLDEPTNHLDLPSREALETALQNYGGTLIIVSHDRYFINRLATRILFLENAQITSYTGNYDDFLNVKKPQVIEQKPKKVLNEGGKEYFRKKQRESEKRKLATAVSRLEKEIEAAESEISALNEELSRDEIAADYQKTLELTAELEQKNKTLETLLEQWANATEELEKTEENL